MKKKILILFFGFISIFSTFNLACNYKEVNANNKLISEINKKHLDTMEESTKIANIINSTIDNISTTLNNQQIVFDSLLNKNFEVSQEDLITKITFNDYFNIDGFLKISDIYIKINGKVNYNSNSNTFTKDDLYISRIDDGEINSGIESYFIDDKTEIIFGRRVLDESNTLSVLKINNKDINEEVNENEILHLLEQTFVSNLDNNYYLYDLKINNNFTNKVFFTESYLKFINKDNQEVIIKKYEEDFHDSYFSKNLKINDINIKYGNIINKDNDFVFYKIESEVPLLLIAKNDINISNFFEQ